MPQPELLTADSLARWVTDANPGLAAARAAAEAAADDEADALRLRVVAQAKAAYAEWRFVDRALADTRRARFALSERRADLLADLAAARAEVLEMQQSVKLFANRLVPLADEYLDAAVADYQSGAGAFLNVITAEQRKLDTDLAHARARADYERRYAALERWTGGPFHPSRPTPLGAEQ